MITTIKTSVASWCCAEFSRPMIMRKKPEPAGSCVNVLVSPPGWKEVELFVTGIGGVLDAIVCSTQTFPVVKIFSG